MSRARQHRRGLARWRYRARYQHLTVERGDAYGFPSDVYDVSGHHPGFPDLLGWVFRCWQYRVCAPNPPHWYVPWLIPSAGVRPGEWLLHRVGDGLGIYAVLADHDYRRWRDWRPDSE